MPIPAYEIYALKYGGPYTKPVALMYFFQDINKFMQINYYIFVIRDRTCGRVDIYGEIRRYGKIA